MARRTEWEKGVLAAADVADGYNSLTIHDHILGDCIAHKLNVRKKKPRKNKKRIVIDHHSAAIRGVVLGVAEMLRFGGTQRAAEQALRAAGITRADAKKAGAASYDLEKIDWKWCRKRKTP